MTALAFELFEDAHQKSSAWMAGIAFVAGAAVFVAVSSWLDRRVANAIGTDTMSAREVAALDPKERGRGAAGAKEGAGFALLAAVTLDGIPENAALGVTLGGEDETSPSSSRSSRRTSRNHWSVPPPCTRPGERVASRSQRGWWRPCFSPRRSWRGRR